ncbi:Solute carrier family 49 member A3 (Major facilitator superfamily domain-containing protein 7-a) (Major facilitator superfamily domain-containing protein 7-b) (Myosin light polypeptide 5 regulatory protein) (MYL5) [Durusdinium trenchii]|uniref:Major facilitator superfamily (MFS) profile domain-containing protein n=1 Tax=Durusdinium trenchii TaxID=1381693 RepID=A0ABP0HDZ5_9DINO
MASSQVDEELPLTSDGQDYEELADVMSEHDAAVADGRIATFKARWLTLALFCMSTATNAMLWITFSPINSVTQTFYGVSAAEVNVLSIVYLAAYVPVSLGTNFVFNRLGLRFGIVLACALNVLSGLVRWLSTESNESQRGASAFTILVIGQTFGAMAQPFFTNSPAKLGAVWFPAEERDLAVAVAALFNPIGIAVGTVLPAFYTFDNDDKVRMYDLLLMELIITVLVLVLVGLLFKAKPPVPPSLSELNKGDLDVVKEMKDLVRNRNFMILFVTFGTGLGFFNALTTLVEQFVEKSGYTTDDASQFSALLVGCGIVNAIAMGIVMDKTHKYRELLRGTFVVAGILVVAFVLVLRPNNFVAIAFVFGMMGAAMLPLLPIALESAAECTYPVSEDLSTGWLVSAGQVTGIFFIVVLGNMLESQPVYTTYTFEPTYIVIVVCTAFFCVGAQFFNGQYLRLEAEC